ncbi:MULTISPECIES: ABC transporter ATP-binding protein [Lactobacillus]|jgi:ABC-type multidrug transport system, ATPase component|uniref:ABC transporter ATP-binding protein n=1 Tax=Lactobacillus TaxID=1578 RepID=UPI0023EF76AC|nr:MULTISPECIES: ABC transporter ATP-binding protein [Lactobacillus]
MLIETYNLTKKYGKKLALNKVDLKVDRGQLVAYLGTNGAGKSTTINILTGLLKPTSGTITYAKDLKIGVVFQNSVLDDVLSVKDNLNLRAQMYHDISKNWLEQLIDLIGIRKFLNQKYGTLSGGQKRRVDIARALIDRPNILFLDEPTTGLDLQTRIVIWNLLQKLQKEQGLTIFLTTHYLEEAENADQMYILENGQVLANGSAHEIKNKYAPSKLVIKLNENQQLTTAYPVIAKDKHIELNGLDKDEAITLLHQNQAKIKSFEYRQGSIDDAFINIAGKELQ